MRHNDARLRVGEGGEGGRGAITNDVLEFKKILNLKIWKFTYCNLLLLDLYDDRWKKIIYQLRKWLKSYKILSKIKNMGTFSFDVSLCPAGAHMYRSNLWTIHPSVVSSFRKDTRVKTKKLEISNNHYFLLFVWM